MKTLKISKTTRLFALTISVAFLAGTVAASEAPSSKGGATLLVKPQPLVSTAEPLQMSCEKCKDTYVAQKDLSDRGATKPEVRVARHLCSGCDTTIVTTGVGKAEKDVVTHKCTTCGPASPTCCKTKS